MTPAPKCLRCGVRSLLLTLKAGPFCCRWQREDTSSCILCPEVPHLGSFPCVGVSCFCFLFVLLRLSSVVLLFDEPAIASYPLHLLECEHCLTIKRCYFPEATGILISASLSLSGPRQASLIHFSWLSSSHRLEPLSLAFCFWNFLGFSLHRLTAGKQLQANSSCFQPPWAPCSPHTCSFGSSEITWTKNLIVYTNCTCIGFFAVCSKRNLPRFCQERNVFISFHA